MTAALLIAWLVPSARADGLERANVALAFEGLPDSTGLVSWRDSMGVDVGGGANHWRIDLRADFRTGTFVHATEVDALQQLTLTHREDGVALVAGRLTRRDARGWAHLDGLDVTFGGSDVVVPSLWVGSPWRPDTGLPTGEGAVMGTQVRLTPEIDTYGLRPAGAVGMEVQQSNDGMLVRGWLEADARSLRGSSMDLLAELGSDDAEGDRTLAARVELRGRMPLAAGLDGDAELRWEDLAPTDSWGQVGTPLRWLAPEGYGVAAVGVSHATADGGFEVRGGPMVRAREETGTAVGSSATAAWRGQLGLPVELRLRSAFIGPSALVGAAVGTGGDGALTWSGSAGLYRLQGLDERAAMVGELRLSGERELVRTPRGGTLNLRGVAAGGADRLLVPWWRAGVLLTASLAEEGL